MKKQKQMKKKIRIACAVCQVVDLESEEFKTIKIPFSYLPIPQWETTRKKYIEKALGDQYKLIKIKSYYIIEKNYVVDIDQFLKIAQAQGEPKILPYEPAKGYKRGGGD